MFICREARSDKCTYRNNNFHFAAERDFQKICPFAAHVRKTNPRADLEAGGFSIESRRIMRHGIQFGDEVTDEERDKNMTMKDRGLLFVSYQSSLANGFAFMQKSV
jgi:deferrochelatase/peroxidase EfeB